MADLRVALRKATARQFYDCSKQVNVGNRFVLAPAAWSYAMQWHVPTAIVRGAIEAAVLPFYLVRAAVRRTVRTDGGRSIGSLH